MAKVNQQKPERKKLGAFSESNSPVKTVKETEPPISADAESKPMQGLQKQITIKTNKVKEENYLVRREELEQRQQNSARRSSEKKARLANTDLPLQMETNQQQAPAISARE